MKIEFRLISMCAVALALVHGLVGTSDAREKLKASAVYRESETDIAAMIETLANLRTPVISGKETPKWEDFEQLQKLLAQIVQFKAKLKLKPGAMDELLQLARELREKVLADARVKEKFDARAAYAQTASYQPTEFELKLAYQFVIGRINRELPSDLRIPLQHMPEDPRHEKLIQEAREYVAKSKEEFHKRFVTSGYKTYADFESYLRAHKDPRVKRALEVMDQDQIRPVIRRPENARFWVPKTGFQNQFITGSSRGSYDPNFRIVVESKLYGLENQVQYAKRDPEFRPKYGTITVKAEAKVNMPDGVAENYGSDIYGLKLGRVVDRLTFTTNDSFSVYMGDNWDSMVIPWSARLLMVPFFLNAVDEKRAGSYEWADSFARPSRDFDVELKTVLGSGYYWEIQVMGPVGLDDVDYFEFQGQPPTGEFLRELRMRGIPIFDGRNRPPVSWQSPD